MSIYLRDIDAYDPDEFSADVKALIESGIKEVQIEDLYDTESDFYHDLLSKIADVLYSFCEEIADEVWDAGQDSGYDSGRESGWDEGYEEARREYEPDVDVDELESDLSSARSQIEELESEIEELRSSPALPKVDIDDLREAIRADLIAEMLDDEQD
jgi:flagellar biosynthesis/type III secretory pathway protein FliH